MDNTELIAAEQQETQTGDMPADAGQENVSGEQPPHKASWDEILRDPDYAESFNRQVQEIVRRRLKGRSDAEAELQRLKPLLSALQCRYGGAENDVGGIDADRVAGEILSELRGPQQLREHLEVLSRQAEALRESLPEFRLERELEDERFLRLTAPHVGLSVEEAYYALHRRQIAGLAARQSLEALSRALCTQGARPRETGGKSAAYLDTADPAAMSADQRRALKRRIYEARAMGKKLPYGG